MMMNNLNLLCLVMLFANCQGEKPVQKFPVPEIEFSPKQYVCYRADGTLHIDGLPNEDAWEQAEWTSDFVDIEGSLKPLPRLRTRARMLWDDIYFYVAAELEEPDVWATLSKRDTVIFSDNDFEVFIDPDGDTHQYYELEMNAFNTVWDLFLDKPYRDDARPLFNWDIHDLRTAVHVDGMINQPGDRDRGWTVEIAIPWKVLKECANKAAPPRDGDQWRINFSRVEWRTEISDGHYRKVVDPKTGKSLPEDNWVWSPQGLIAMHYPEMWGFVLFSEKIAGSSRVEFKMPAEEQVKWALRKIYYAQKNHFMRYGAYTDDVKRLGMKPVLPQDYRWPPRLKVTDHFFEACISDTQGKVKFYIAHDGKVWR